MSCIDIDIMPAAEAAKLTSENKYGYIWPVGLYVIVDNQRAVLNSRQEAENLIAQDMCCS